MKQASIRQFEFHSLSIVRNQSGNPMVLRVESCGHGNGGNAGNAGR
jgi:hypothetical protein